MNKDNEKNRLDLAYRRQLIYLNAVVLLGTTGFLAFLAPFVLNRQNLLYGFIVSIVILVIVVAWHKKVDKSLREISNSIRKLSFHNL